MERGHVRHRSEQFPGPTYHGFPPRFDQSKRPTYEPYAYIRDGFPAQEPQAVNGRAGDARAWGPLQQSDIRPSSTTIPPNFVNPPQHASNVVNPTMPPLFDATRRRSIGGDCGAIPPQSDQLSAPPFRAMPPPSPPSTAFPSHVSAPFGPPTASPFNGIRDLASLSSNRRSGGGMSISSILGGPGDDTRSMQPPSPQRARASSMREPYTNGGFRERSPNTPRSATATMDPGRAVLDRFSDQAQRTNGFRAFYPPQTSAYPDALPGRPSSQPVEQQPPALLSEVSHKSDETHMSRLPTFRSFPSTHEYTEPRRVDNSWANADRSTFSSPGANKEHRDVFSPAYSTKQFVPNNPIPGFRPAPLQESIEVRSTGRNSPPYPIGFRPASERPLTYEDHQRMERQELRRKDSDPRSLFNISPELRRRGRDSPLPQAVQGAQPRHIGPGGDHPSIKSEFGRMFSGLGAGVGSVTPVAGQSMNNGTPTRISPTRPDDLESPLDEHDQDRSASARPRKQGMRRPRDEEPEKYDGRMTPSLSQRGNKRSKTAHPLLHHHHHHHHHTTHHHHHHDAPEQAGTYGMIRFPSNNANQPAHRHHHHHHTHAATHHHAALPVKKPAMIVRNESVLESVANKPRKHLGSMPYTATASYPSGRSTSDQYLSYSNSAGIMPRFDDKENCTFSIRVPRWYVSRSRAEIQAGEQSRFEEICRGRRIWGTDIYTDDSDVVAAAVHSGWLKGDFGYANEDISILDQDENIKVKPQSQHLTKPAQPVSIPAGRDVHITVLILPTLSAYAGTHKNHIWSRDWVGTETHDGMSFMVHKIEFVREGPSDRGVGRDASSRKARMALEQSRRSEAAAALLLLPGMASSVRNTVEISV